MPIAEPYLELRPDPRLAAWVECFWVRAPASGRQAVSRILPDGCADIVLEFDASAGAPPACAYAVGTMTRPLVHADSAAQLIGVRFRPGRARGVFGIAAAELTDQRVDMANLWQDADAAFAPLAGSPDAEARVRAFERLLAARLAGAVPVAPEVEAAICAIIRAGGNLAVSSLGPALGVTRQHLARRFTESVGTPPKAFARVVRGRRLLARAGAAHTVDWTALALDAGYYDHSHLVADVKALTGLTPGAWLAERR